MQRAAHNLNAWVLAVCLAAASLMALATLPAGSALADDDLSAGQANALTTQGELTTQGVSTVQSGSVDMLRLYNPYTGEHFYTAVPSERDHLVAVGWRFEGTGWIAPTSSSTPVFRLYNPYAGDHHYTMSAAERDGLVQAGWRSEGTGWYSADAGGVRIALYRQYNPYAKVGTHNFTTSADEHCMLVNVGWRPEGAAWYGLASASGYTGWMQVNGAWRYYQGGAMAKGWLVVTTPPAIATVGGGAQRYWLDSTGTLATSRLIDPSSARDAGAGYLAYATGGGYVVRGKYDTGTGRVYVADNDGRLPTTTGWLVTAAYDGFMSRYFIDGATHAALSGSFTVGGQLYWGVENQGYVARNTRLLISGTCYNANDDGVLSPDAVSNRLIAKAAAYSSPSSYLIMVDIDNPCTVVLTGYQGHWRPIFVWDCCTGHPSTPTVTGVYSVGIKGHSFGESHGYSCYYYTQIYGDYLFHTSLYYANTHTVLDGRMGERCTQGCVRLADENALWIYNNVPHGTTVVTTT